jgi:ribosomal protein S18 acetylase RimI-like enzyme
VTVRRAGPEDADDVARLLYDFNTEYDEPTPDPPELAVRIREVMGADTIVLLAGDGPDGLAVLRFRLSLWSSGKECYLAELYVVPGLRGQGIGRALMEAAIEQARRRGARRLTLRVLGPNTRAQALYESLGFEVEGVQREEFLLEGRYVDDVLMALRLH